LRPRKPEDYLGPADRARFLSKVDKNGPSSRPELGPCWVWTAGLTRDGYGQFRVGQRSLASHRVAWEFDCGQIPPGMHVLHKCDTRNCVRGEHLFLGTHQDNVVDMCSKNRQARHWQRAARSTNRSGLVGIYWKQRIGKWGAHIYASGRTLHLGYFTDREAAAAAYDVAARFYKGADAYQNFPASLSDV
jgi:HNH endonuclease